MPLTVIKRVTCDPCGMEEPKEYVDIPYTTHDQQPDTFIICHNCIRLLGAVDAFELSRFMMAVGAYSQMKERRCEECREIVTENLRFPERELFDYLKRIKSALNR